MPHFEPHEKAIYSPPEFPERKYDPLDIDRKLTILSGGTFGDLMDRYRPIKYGPDGKPETGDISEEGVKRAEVDRAEAETEVVRIARKAFGLPEFPDCTDGQCLEVLHDYLWWMEGKGSREGTTPTSPPPSDSSLPAN